MSKRIAKQCIMMCFLVMGFGILACANAQAQVSVVVSKSSAHNPGEADVKSFFSAVKFAWENGAKVQVVEQPDTEVATAFYTKFLGKSVSMIRKEWTKLILSGQASAPVKCANDDAVKKAVAANGDAIGFISSSSVDGTVKEVLKIQ